MTSRRLLLVLARLLSLNGALNAVSAILNVFSWRVVRRAERIEGELEEIKGEHALTV